VEEDFSCFLHHFILVLCCVVLCCVVLCCVVLCCVVLPCQISGNVRSKAMSRVWLAIWIQVSMSMLRYDAIVVVVVRVVVDAKVLLC
jgi:hypothetical protein